MKKNVLLNVVVWILLTLSFAVYSGASDNKDLIAQANQYASSGDFQKAKELLNSKSNDPDIIEELEKLNLQMILAGYPKEDFLEYSIKSGDNLDAIGKKNKVPYEFIMAVNNIKSPQSIRVGQKILIPVFASQFSIKVDIKNNVLTLLRNNVKIKKYKIASGAVDSPTPVGEFTIYNRIVEPTWTFEGKNIPGGDPKNGLGSRWLGFKERKQYGIHGTNEPDSIGKSVSHGCIRMHNHDVEELFKIIPVGTKVEIL